MEVSEPRDPRGERTAPESRPENPKRRRRAHRRARDAPETTPADQAVHLDIDEQINELWRIIEIFENQRRLTAFHKKYSGADLLPIDPGCFSDEKGKDRYLEIDLVPLPENPTTHSNGSNGSNGRC